MSLKVSLNFLVFSFFFILLRNISLVFSIDLFKKDVESKNRSYKKKDSTRRFLVSTKKVNDHRKNVCVSSLINVAFT